MYVPVKTYSARYTKKYKYPLDEQTRDAIKLKRKLSRKMTNENTATRRKEYKRARNKVKSLTRKARKSFERELATESKQNPKKFWKYVNSKSKVKNGVDDLYMDSKDKSRKTKNDAEKAEVLSRYFKSVFTRETDGEIPTIESKHIITAMQKIKIEPKEITALLKSLNVNKAPGIDNLHPRLLKELSEQLTKPLQLIFQQSLDSCNLPDDRRRARISAIYKKGDKSMAENYRPVSLTCILCKTLEKIVRNHIVDHMSINELFSDKQFGFLSGRSTTLQLLSVLDKWPEAIDSGNNIDCIYMDFQKAFDTVPHKRLISKLKSYGINEDTVEWINNFLTNRLQRVNIKNECSEWVPVTSGIPQGSVLSPILFVIYMNELPEIVQSELYLFADDTKIFYINSPNLCDGSVLQTDLNALVSWSEKWLLKFHPDKCMHMHLGKNQPDDLTYFLLNTELKTVTHEKDLGVIFDNQLDFEKHICAKVNKANQIFAVIRRTFKHLDIPTFIPLYKSLVRSYLDYAASIYYPFKMKLIHQIESVQKRATKQVPELKHLSYPERLKKLNLPTLSFRRVRGDMIEMFKITNGIYDEKVTNFIPFWTETTQRSSNRTNSLKIYPCQSRSNARKNSFRVRITKIWNTLPNEIVCAPSLNLFKNRLDSYWDNQELKFDYKANSITIASGSVMPLN